jgi:hypothetical protein
MEAAEAGVLKRLVPVVFGTSREGRAMDAPERTAARNVMLSHTPAPVPAPLTLVEQSMVPVPERAPVGSDGRPIKQVVAQRLPRTAKSLFKWMLGYTGDDKRYPAKAGKKAAPAKKAVKAQRDGLAVKVRSMSHAVPFFPCCSSCLSVCAR